MLQSRTISVVLWALHDYHGVAHLDPTTFLIRSTLLGAKRLLGCESVQADPLSPEDLQRLWAHLDMNPICGLTVLVCCCYHVPLPSAR